MAVTVGHNVLHVMITHEVTILATGTQELKNVDLVGPAGVNGI